ncbi:hypothetical protein KAR91_12905 [Candidatus Pacearchaeota archaeon]|nr:hypothetical protein [Candidatus Pacearchaeota archaeon]
MAISKQAKQKICKLAREGKTCVKIQRENFPNLNWWEVRGVLEEAGTSSSLGIMKEISGKINKARNTAGKNKELSDTLLRVQRLARQLYYRSKEDYRRLEKIRKAVEG